MKTITTRKLTLILSLSVLFILFTGCDNEPDGTPVDFNLTKYSTTMAHSTVVDMYENSDNYVGKTIKIKGLYDPFFVEELGRELHYIEVEGYDGCCPQYLEFKWDNENDFSADINNLKEKDRMVMIGVFGLYDEGDYTNLPYLEVTEWL